jgi:hypothetical protein
MRFGREDKNEDLCCICAVGIPNLNESNVERGEFSDLWLHDHVKVSSDGNKSEALLPELNDNFCRFRKSLK